MRGEGDFRSGVPLTPYSSPLTFSAMFIELTDHLRCPATHDESFLVLLPEDVVNRQVRSGTLGCPLCNATYPIIDGVAHFGAPVRRSACAPAAPPPVAGLAAFLGLSGPGGYVALVGDVAAVARVAHAHGLDEPGRRLRHRFPLEQHTLAIVAAGRFAR